MKQNNRFLKLSLILMLCLLCLCPMHVAAAEQPVKIASFAEPSVQEVMVFEKGTLEEVKETLPETLEAADEQGNPVYIPVTWECVGDYEETSYYYYQFVPVIDEEIYEIPENQEVPYIWLVLSTEESGAWAVTSSSNERTIYKFLVEELDCNFATALGILANLERESSFNPKAKVTSSSGTILYFGICQWGGSRLDNLKSYCSKNGYAYDSVEGQLNFLKYELYGAESRAWSKMQGIEDTQEGAYLAGYNWARYFERCSSVYYEVSAKRARDVYWTNYVTEAPVYRISGADRYKTGLKIADQLKKAFNVDRFENIVVATGTGFADALSGSYLAYVKKAPILLTDGKNIQTIKQYMEHNFDTEGTIYLLGGENAISKSVEEQLSGYTVKRLFGKTRYETNLEILKEADESPKELLVCTGTGFSDSLSASATGKPVFLVEDELNDVQKEYLISINVQKIYIIGGGNAVSTKVEEELSEYAECSRVSGSARYETSVAVAKAFVPKAKSAVLAYSHNYPDGLCGGPLAAALKAPLILAKTEGEKAATEYIASEQIENGFVLGGSSLISDEAVRRIYDLEVSDRITVY